MDGPILAFQGSIKDSGEDRDYWPAHDRTYFAGICPYCGKPCRVRREAWNYDASEQQDSLVVCLTCGWWSFEADQREDLSGNSYYFSSRAMLKSFAVDDQDAPYRELARYLAANQDRLLDVDPARFEGLVAAVYQDVLGHPVEFCSYGRPDRGIDVICGRKESGETFGIQVKRYKSPIELGQIHQFLGALQLAGQRSGVFVTTSRFRTGCYEVIKESRDLLGVEIDLVDGQRFLEFLALMNQPATHWYFCDWGRIGYTWNYKLENHIPVAEIATWPTWPGRWRQALCLPPVKRPTPPCPA